MTGLNTITEDGMNISIALSAASQNDVAFQRPGVYQHLTKKILCHNSLRGFFEQQ